MLPDGIAEEIVLAHAGWDEAVNIMQRRQRGRGSAAAAAAADDGMPIYGMPGARAPRGRIR